MATKVGLENNILKIDNGVKIEYFNASWCSILFSSTSVFIKHNSEPKQDNLQNPYEILFTDFQDLSATPYATESAIATYLSDKIG